MSGIDRLRTLAGAWDEWGLGGALAEIADQIERELQEERDRWDSELCEAQMDKSRVTVVYLEMNKHVLGHEGMEDSPVARWARELREALGGAVTDEDREAAEWVRKRGGIDYVKGEWRSRVPYDRYERRRQRLLGHIAECETALGRRNQRIEELGRRVSDLTRENAELRRRAMPEGMEWLLEVWPRWSNGEYCRFGDWWTADRYGDYEPRQLRRLAIYAPELLDEWEQGDGESYGYEWDFMRPSELDYRPDKVEPPAPSVLAADGEPLEVGQTVWNVEDGTEWCVTKVKDGKAFIAFEDFAAEECDPSLLTHQRPVMDADGVPINVGDTVWFKTSGEKMLVDKIEHRPEGFWALELFDDGSKRNSAPVGVLTHAKPEPPDSRQSVINEIGDEMAARIDLLVSSGRWSDAD